MHKMIPFCTFHDELTNNNNNEIIIQKNINDGEDMGFR